MILDDRIFRPQPLPGIDPARLVLVTEPAVEPVSVEELEEHANLGTGGTAAQKRRRAMIIAAARRHFEAVTGLALVAQTWRLELDRVPLPAGLEIPRAPLRAAGDDDLVVNAITYLDTAGAEQTLDAAHYVQPRPGLPRSFARLRLAIDGAWPDVADLPGAFRVEFNAGFGATAEDVPEDIRLAILFLATWWHEQPQAVNVGNIVGELPLHLEAMISNHRIAFIG